MLDVAILAQSSSVPLQWLDVLILVTSVIGVTAFGMWIGRKEESTSDYYLAGKTVAWWAVAGSIFGTNISSHHMVGMMGAGLKEGFAQANYEFGAIFGLLMLCYFFLPFYRRMGFTPCRNTWAAASTIAVAWSIRSRTWRFC